MKPPPFEYFDPETPDEALERLAEAGDDGKILAGGQSLVPILNFRLARPLALIDINRLPLAGIEQVDGVLRIGALNRHRAVETSPLVRERCPVLAAAVPFIGHRQIRNRGTFGGSLAHADPSAELPLITVLLDGEIATRRPGGTSRVHAAGEFFLGYLSTALDVAELITEVRLPLPPPGAGWAFQEVARRAGDFALVEAAALVELAPDGTIATLRVAVGGAGPAQMRLPAVEAAARGRTVDAGLLDELDGLSRDGIDPDSDLHASADYRREVTGTLVRRAVAEAAGRAKVPRA